MFMRNAMRSGMGSRAAMAEPALAAPATLTVTPGSDADLDCANVTGATAYLWERRSVGEDAFVQRGETALSAFTDSHSDLTGLLEEADFTYLGAFRMPESATGHYFGFARSKIAFDPADGKLFATCKQSSGGALRCCKLTIPALVTGGTVAALNRATITIDGTDIFSTIITGVYDSIGQMHVYGDKLIYDFGIFYDAGFSMTASHATCNLDLTGVAGPYTIGSLYPGKLWGPMADVPADYQAGFGGPVVTGRGGGNIVSTSSDGPCAVAFDPDDFGGTVTSTTQVLYGTNEYEPLSGTDGAGPNLLWCFPNNLAGTFFADGASHRCLGFVADQGTGVYWYGDPNDPPEGGVNDPRGGQGTHAPYYRLYLHLFDPEEVEDAAAPEDNVPYSVFELAHPFTVSEGDFRVNSATYDATNRKLYISMDGADMYGLDPVPLVLVYEHVA